MGGYGSGFQGFAKTVVEDCWQLSADRMVRAGILKPNRWSNGRWVWRNRSGEEKSSIGYVADTSEVDGYLQVNYTFKHSGKEYRYQIGLTTTEPYFGGVRFWYLCPACGKRVGCLYLPPGGDIYACRACYDLTYTSCQESHMYDSLFASPTVERWVCLVALPCYEA